MSGIINFTPQLRILWMVAYWNDLNTGCATCSSECGGEFIIRNQDFEIEWEPVEDEDEITNCTVCRKVYEDA